MKQIQKLSAAMILQLFMLLIQFSTILCFLPGHMKFGGRLGGLGRARTKMEHTDLRNRFTSDTNKESPQFGTMGSKLQSDCASSKFNIFSTQLPKLRTEELQQKLALHSAARKIKKAMHVKMDFYSSYTTPIEPHYSAFMSSFISGVFAQTTHERYVYDPLQAFGLCTQYYTIMKEYARSDQVEPIFDKMLHALSIDPQLLKTDATRIIKNIDTTQSISDESFLSSDSELSRLLRNVRENSQFHYTDAWGIGLCRLLELRQASPSPLSFEKWSKLLLRVPVERLERSWRDFNEQQSRIQCFEAARREAAAQSLQLCDDRLTKGRRTRKVFGATADRGRSLAELNKLAREGHGESSWHAEANDAHGGTRQDMLQRNGVDRGGV